MHGYSLVSFFYFYFFNKQTGQSNINVVVFVHMPHAIYIKIIYIYVREKMPDNFCGELGHPTTW